MPSQFESLMAAGNFVLDEYFDESLVLRAKGIEIAVNGTLVPAAGDEDVGADNAKEGSWQEVVILLHVAQLIDGNGNAFEVTGGMEIVKPLATRNKIYMLTRGPGSLWSEPYDVEETRIAAYGKFIRYESLS